MSLGLGLCNFGKQESVETIIAALEVIPEPYKSTAVTMVEICAYAGTGNVIKVQQLLHICSEHYESSDREESRDKNKDKSKEKEDKVSTST